MLSHISLHNFRNHATKELTLAPQTVIVGPNGSGKTAILEAISLLSLTTSWRTERDSEVVAWEKPFTRIVAGDRELVIQRHPYYKRIRIDGMSKRAGEVLGTLPSILFQPDDSALIHGSPAYRRSSIDRLLSQTDHEYAKALLHCQRVVKQRNKLLKRIQEGQAQVAELDYWDAQLAHHGEYVKELRKSALPLLEETVSEVFQQLVPHGGGITITYHQSPRGGEQSFLRHLEENRYKEVASGMTLYGPHREDIDFIWQTHPASEVMSRGQSRALVIAFKAAELKYLENHTETPPIFLLDDVFSEFDEERRERIITLINGYQVVMTVTDLGELAKKLPKTVQVVEL